MVDRAMFAQECVRQGVIFGVNPHFILGVAQLRSGISYDSAGGQVGPFRLNLTEWNANSNNDEFDVHFTPTQISSPIRQCAVFALMAHRAFDAFVSTESRNPSAKELYLKLWPDTGTAMFPRDFQAALENTAALIDPAADAVLDDPKLVPPTLSTPDQSTTRPVVPPGLDSGTPLRPRGGVSQEGTEAPDNRHGLNTQNTDTALYSMDYLMQKGWTKEAAASAVGQILTEKPSFRPLNKPGEKTDHGSEGLFQWRSDRLIAGKKWAADNHLVWGKIDTQLAFFNHEYSSQGAEGWKDVKTIEDGNIMGAKYERYAGYKDRHGNITPQAQRALDSQKLLEEHDRREKLRER